MADQHTTTPSRLFLALAALVAAGVAVPAVAGAPEVARSRIETYRELGAAFKGINDGLRASEVQTVLIAQSARQVRNVAQAQYTLFPAGSGPQPGVKTNARPEIWSQAGKFKAAQDSFAKAAGAFQQAVNAKNVAAMRTQAKALGATCKGCHDAFRNRVD